MTTLTDQPEMTLTLLLLNTSCPVLANGVDPDWLASELILGWSGGAKVLCIVRHRDTQLILAYSWARPAILVAGMGRGGMFLFLLFLHFHSCFSFFHFSLLSLVLSLLALFSLSLGDDKMIHKG